MLPLSLGPTKIISEYDGGCNFWYLGILSKDIRANWPLLTQTDPMCAATSVARLRELPDGQVRTRCFIRGLVYAVETRQWEQVDWIVARLPADHALYSDKLTCAIIETGVVPAIHYAISVSEPKVARSIFRIGAANAVRKGHGEAAKYLCTRFVDNRVINSVAIAASCEGDLSLVEWCLDTMVEFPTDATRALVYRGNIKALERVKGSAKGLTSLRSDQLVMYAALGGCLEMLEWVLENTTPKYNAREVCVMVSAKGLLSMLKHLISNRGFDYDTAECVRFAKNGSGVASWLLAKEVK